MRFGRACSIILERIGKSQADICRSSGLSSSYVSQLLSGKVKDTTFEKACAIADAMGVTLEEIRVVMDEESETTD